MKNRVKFLMPILVISTVLFSCKNSGKNKSNKIILDFGQFNSSEVTRIDNIEFQTLADDAKLGNFMIIISSNTCTCWREFKPLIEKYIKNNNLICYEIPYNVFADLAPTYSMIVSSSTTTLAIFENGKVKYTLKSGINEEMDDYKKLEKFLDSTIEKPGCYLVNEEDINTIKNSDKSAVIYYEKSGCGDCSYINPRMLRTYVKNHKDMNPIYVLDCQSWVGKEDYQNKKDEYGLSSVNNPLFGYDTGYFPFFSYLENGKYKSGCVIFNDEVEGSVVTNSYFNSERVKNLEYTNTVIQGKELLDDDIKRFEENSFWKQDSAAKVYEPILNDFLNYYLPKTTFTF